MLKFQKKIAFFAIIVLSLSQIILPQIAQAQIFFNESLYLEQESSNTDYFEQTELSINESSSLENNYEILQEEEASPENYTIQDNQETIETPYETLEEPETNETLAEEYYNFAGTPPAGDPFDFSAYENKNKQNSKLSNVNTHVDEFSGATIIDYPFTLPPGRANMQPSLNLRYNSQNQNHENIIGYGWDLNIPQITRSSRKGYNEMYSLSEFNLQLENKSITLLPINLTDSIHGTYGAEIDEDFWQIQFTINNTWVIRNNSGITYTFGSSGISRQDNGNQIYKWMLETSEDTNGNTIEYEYYKDSGQIYPKRIIYTNNKGQKDGLVEVRFQPFYKGPTSNDIREEKINSYKPGFLSETKYKINSIEIIVKGVNNNQPVKTWQLNYKTEDSITKRNLLSSIQESGIYFDESTNTYKTITRPSTEFTYKPQGQGWKAENYGVPVNFNLTGAQYGDLNGDGLIDAVARGGASGVWINQGNKQWIKGNGFTLPVDFMASSSRYTFLADFNGDGFNDIYIQPNLWTSSGFWINNQNKKFVKDNSYKSPNLGTYIHVADMNGDGLSDFLDERGIIYTNNGKGEFLRKGGLGSPPAGRPTQRIYVLDVNGDGLNDLITGFANYYPTKIHFNTGGGWYTSQWGAVGFNGNIFMRMFDANGDGLTDYGISSPTGSQYAQVNELYINNGQHFTKHPTQKLPSSLTSYTNPLDANSDFADDIGNAGTVYENQWGPSGLLTEVKNPIGGKISFEYSLSAFPIAGSHNNPKISNRYLATKITKDNGIGQKFTTSYEYKDGAMSFQSPDHRTFGGFHEVIKTDPEGNVTKTFYHQGGGIDGYNKGEFKDHFSKIGKPYRIEIWGNHPYYGGGNVLYKKIINEWDHKDLGNNRYFPYLTRSVTSDFEGGRQSRHQGYSYKYDNHGNVIEEIDYGTCDAGDQGFIMDIGNDLLKTTYSYATPTSGFIYKAPYSIKIYDQNNAKLRETRYYYDNQSLSYITKGHLTQTSEFLDTANQYISSKTAYDNYGNPVTQTNPRGYSGKITYDSNGYFPKTITNAKNQSISLVFDPITGQVKKYTGLNNEITQNTYDSFGRLIKTKSSPTVGNKSSLTEILRMDYTETSVPSSTKITKPTLLSNPALKSDFIYYDGFGNQIQTRTLNKNAQYSVTNTKYNGLFQPIRTLLPYFEYGATYKAPNWLFNGITTEYDGLGRAVSIKTPLGTTSTKHELGKTTITDAEGNTKTLFNDIFGNLIKVHEKNGNDIYETVYDWSPFGQLTKTKNIYWDQRDFTYDSLGRLTSQSLLYSLGETPRYYFYNYDKNGNTTSVRDPKNQTINYTYDSLDRIISEDYPGVSGTEISYEYDNSTHTNSNGKISKVTFGGQTLKNINQNGSKNGTGQAVIAYMYDNLGNISIESKVLGNKTYHTQFQHDNLGRIKQITYPGLAGNAGNKITYEYSNDHTLNTVKYTNGATTAPIISDIKYAANGQLLKVNYGNGTITNYTYEPQWNNLLKTLITTSGSKSIQNIAYTYDKIGNVKTLKESGANKTARNMTFTYDSLSRLMSVDTKDSSGNLLYTRGYTYDAIGNIINKGNNWLYYDRIRNGLPTSVTEISNFSNSGVVGGTGQAHSSYFTYDKNGNITEEKSSRTTYDQTSGQTNTQTIINNNTFDYNNQLIKVNKNTLTCPASAAVSGHCNPTGSSTKSTTQLLAAYAYDHTGERLMKSWDYNSGTSSAPSISPQKVWYINQYFETGSEGTFEYIYAFGRKIARSELTSPLSGSAGNSLSTSIGAADFGPANINCSFNSGSTSGSSSSSDPNNSCTKPGSSGSSGSPPTKSVATPSPATLPTINFVHPDHLGSTSLLTDLSGNLVEEADYYPYGETHTESVVSGLSATKHKFTSKEQDKQTGLYYYGARYYSASQGRFISVDPLQLRITAALTYLTDPQSLNEYAYARNNPLKYVDPTGKYFLPVAINPSDPTLGGHILPPARAEFGTVHTPQKLSKTDKVMSVIVGGMATYGTIYNNPQAVATLFNATVDTFFTAEGATGTAAGANSARKALSNSDKAEKTVSGIEQTKTVIDSTTNYTSNNFRSNLIKLTGENPGSSVHAHHMFPKTYEKLFSQTGIDVNNPIYGSWWKGSDHLKNAYQYNKVWKEFDIKGETQEAIINKASELANKFGLKTNF